VPLLGIFSFVALSILVTTSLSWIRRWSYRVFFVIHLFIAVSILPVLFFHAPPLRIYVVESLILFILDLAARKIDTTTQFSKITQIPHTTLLEIKIPIAPSKITRFYEVPGQHVYLSIPRESRPPKTPSLSLYEVFFNPFTVADVSETDITIVFRPLQGPVTTALNRLADLSKAKPPVSIEGPYGEARRFPNLAVDFDRVLLVAGGVGSTFILPIYNQITSGILGDGQSPTKVALVWSMRSITDTYWIGKVKREKLFGEKEHVKIFLTGEVDDRDGSFIPLEDGSIGMEDVNGKAEAEQAEQSINVSGGYMRPDLRKIVDDTFQAGQEERIAVLVCGPPEMARELRENVGRWVIKGRSVWFHNETFGW